MERSLTEDGAERQLGATGAQNSEGWETGRLKERGKGNSSLGNLGKSSKWALVSREKVMED